MRTIVTLCLISLGLLAGEALAAKQNSYLVKPHEITSTTEALTILRRFMPSKLKPDERCEKYAITLDAITRARLDQFKLAEIGLEPVDQTRTKFRNIDVETLRLLYIDGINAFRQTHIDAAMLDLVDCLSKKFRTLDAKARSYLNNEDLQEIMKQYKSIMALPLDFLVNPATRHPALAFDQLKPAVKTTLLDLFNQDVSKVSSRFQGPSAIPQPEPVVEPEQLNAEASAQTIGDLVDPQPADVLSNEDLELLNAIIGSLHDVYNKLPVDSKLGDRCAAYSKIIEADQSHLNQQLVESVVQEVSNKITSSGPTDEIYRPDENVRENFLFTLSTFPKEDVGHETWIDLVDCVSQWAEEDPKVKEFMNSPEQVQIFDELMKAPEVDGAPAQEPQSAH